MKNAKPAPNKRYTLRRLEAARAPKNRSRATPFVRFCLRHILGRGQCYALPYNLPKTSYT